jgi:hypothetical protein
MKRFICFLTILSLVGCTVFRPVEYTELQLPELIEVGKTYKFTEKDGSVTEMKVTAVSPTKVTGTREHGSGKTILAENLTAVEVERIDGVKTTLAVVGGIILIPVILIALVLGIATGVANEF